MEVDEEVVNKTRQGILGRLDVDKWRSSTKIEALVEELTNLRREDATTKSLVFSQFVNFLDLIAFRLKRAGFNVWANPYPNCILTDAFRFRSVASKERCRHKLETRLSSISVSPCFGRCA